MNFTPDDMDRLERAIVESARIQLSRRGTVYVVVPQEILPGPGAQEELVATSYTGDRMRFALDELEWFDVLN